MKWKHFPSYRPFVRGIQWSPVNSLHNHEAGDLRRYRAQYDVIVMAMAFFKICHEWSFVSHVRDDRRTAVAIVFWSNCGKYSKREFAYICDNTIVWDRNLFSCLKYLIGPTHRYIFAFSTLVPLCCWQLRSIKIEFRTSSLKYLTLENHLVCLYFSLGRFSRFTHSVLLADICISKLSNVHMIPATYVPYIPATYIP